MSWMVALIALGIPVIVIAVATGALAATRRSHARLLEELAAARIEAFEAKRSI